MSIEELTTRRRGHFSETLLRGLRQLGTMSDCRGFAPGIEAMRRAEV